MENKKQTAVEWLLEKIEDTSHDLHHLMKVRGVFDQALQMEKEQIEDAFQDGKWDWDNHIKNGTGSMDLSQYYNETYGK